MKLQILNKKKIFYLLAICLLVLFGQSCFKGGLALQAITGTSGEVLVVIDDGKWKTDAGVSVKEVLEKDVPCLPNSEPMFNVSHVSKKVFDGGMFQSTRNILEVDISDIYSHPKIIFRNNIWAEPQAYIRVQAPDEVAMMNLLFNNEKAIQTYFLNAEFNRYATYFNTYPNLKFHKILKDKFNIDMVISASLLQYKDTTNFFWMYNGREEEQQSLIVFSAPYTGPQMLDSANLNSFCDSVTEANLKLDGGSDSTYLTTEYRTEIIYQPITFRNKFCVEMRGRWLMKNDAMGGPFVRWARVDEQNKKLVVAQAFVYAPNKKKRNNLRQLEAMIHTWAFNYEIPKDTTDTKGK